MTDRENIIIRLALSFMLSNMEALAELFPFNDGKMDYNGETIDAPTEEEVEQIMFTLQG